MQETVETQVQTKWVSMPRNRFFVYGIFLSKRNRDRYGMYNEEYNTVKGFVTRGGGIVTAERTQDRGLALTGLTVSIDEDYVPALDRLEGGYDRIAVYTHDDELVWMYARPGTLGDVTTEEVDGIEIN